MELSIIDKLAEIVNYIFSSFMTIELFLICLFFFALIFINIKRDNKTLKIISTVLLIVSVIALIIVYNRYAISSINTFIKWILNYIYFPSMAMHFMIMLTTIIILIYSLLAKNINSKIQKINMIVSGLLIFMFICTISVSATNNINFNDYIKIYENNTMLAFIQASGFLFFIWIFGLSFYQFFKIFAKKYGIINTEVEK